MTRNLPPDGDRRRSRRMYCALPVLLQNLAQETAFALRAMVVESSAHGCQVRSPRPFMAGLTFSLHELSGRRLAAGRVVRSIPVDGGEWNVAVELDGVSRLAGIVCHRRPPEPAPDLHPLPARRKATAHRATADRQPGGLPSRRRPSNSVQCPGSASGGR